MQKSTCFAVLVSLDDILACHVPFVSLAMCCQQLHVCLHLVVVYHWLGLFRLSFWFGCVVFSIIIFCPELLVLVYMGESVCLQVLGLGLVCSSYQWIGDTMWESLSHPT